MTKFSVVITVFNKEKYIGETIASVLNQTYDNFELIVVNDGSTDNSLKIIKSFNDERIQIISTANSGASSSRNNGIRSANYDFIALLDGDDLWDKNYLSKMEQCIQKFRNCSVFASALAHKYENKIVPSRYNFVQNQKYQIHNYFESSLGTSILSSSSIVFHKKILAKTGYFDSSITSGQDTDLWIRIGLHYDIVFINEFLSFYRFVPESLSNTTFNLEKKAKYDNYKEFEEENKALKKFLDINRYSLALMSKVNNQKSYYRYFKSNLDINSLPLVKKLLLLSPKWVLIFLLWVKSLKGEKLYYKPL